MVTPDLNQEQFDLEAGPLCCLLIHLIKKAVSSPFDKLGAETLILSPHTGRQVSQDLEPNESKSKS